MGQGLLLSPLHGRLSEGVVQASYFLSRAVDDRLFVPCAYLVVHFWVLCEQLRLCRRRPGRCIAREDTGCPFRDSSGGRSCIASSTSASSTSVPEIIAGP